MSHSIFYGYAPDALVLDASSGTLMLDARYDFLTDRVRFEITRRQVLQEGDRTCVATAGDDTLIATGVYSSTADTTLRAPQGYFITLDRIEIGGILVGFVPSEPLQPDVIYGCVGVVRDDAAPGAGGIFDAPSSGAKDHCASAPCFGPGTMIATNNGAVPVEWLETGDRVLTRDHGFQPILWIGRTKIQPGHFARNPGQCPVRIAARTLGPECPTHDLYVTGDHRIMVQSPMADLCFSSTEVLVPSRAWVDAGLAEPYRPEKVYTLTHILCAAHELIVAQGVWVESMFTGKAALQRLAPHDGVLLETLLGGQLTSAQTARPCLTRKEAGLLLSKPAQSDAVDVRKRA